MVRTMLCGTHLTQVGKVELGEVNGVRVQLDVLQVLLVVLASTHSLVSKSDSS